MGVWMTGGLEPSDYWQNVCALANDLLTESPLRDWTVVVAPQSGKTEAPPALDSSAWGCQLDRESKELAVSVPSATDDPDETDPEELATYIVFDLLYERVSGDGASDD
jgi:hypothetical protein